MLRPWDLHTLWLLVWLQSIRVSASSVYKQVYNDDQNANPRQVVTPSCGSTGLISASYFWWCGFECHSYNVTQLVAASQCRLVASGIAKSQHESFECVETTLGKNRYRIFGAPLRGQSNQGSPKPFDSKCVFVYNTRIVQLLRQILWQRHIKKLQYGRMDPPASITLISQKETG